MAESRIQGTCGPLIMDAKKLTESGVSAYVFINRVFSRTYKLTESDLWEVERASPAEFMGYELTTVSLGDGGARSRALLPIVIRRAQL
jgi:hypothetical protein